MALKIFDDRSLTVSLRHVEAKPNGSFQYRRRIPVCLESHYPGKTFYVRSLGRDANELARKVSELTSELDALWVSLRSDRRAVEALQAEGETVGPQCADTPQTALQVIAGYLGARRSVAASMEADLAGLAVAGKAPATTIVPPAVITVRDALKLYLSHHPKGEMKKFRVDVERVVNGLVETLGNLPLSLYTRQQVQAYRDDLLTRNSTGTVRRRLDTVVAVFNKAIAEEGLALANPFENLSIPQEGQDARKREPFNNAELSIIADACRKLDDDIRYIIALQLDTGARAGEIIGLRVSDVDLSNVTPHVRIRPFGTVRSLKTDASERDIPLVGAALWSAGRAIAAAIARNDGDWLFPRYASDKEIKATHASNTLNKWLRSLEGVNRDKTTHCFRHAMRDRLRAAQVPHDIQEAIGGWGTRTIGQGYGNGYPLQVLAEHMRKIVLP